MARPTTWFTPLDRPPFVAEHHDPAGAPAELRVLEISSRGDEPLGRSLSAMRLRAADTDDNRGLPIGSIYQAAKCYGDRGPDPSPLPNGFDAKRRDRERGAAGPLNGFEHNGTFWPAASGSAFYDRLWIKAAGAAGAHPTQNLHGYAAFSDQFHRPGQSVACQARAAAMLVGLDRAGRLGTVFDIDKWASTLGLPPHARPGPANRTRLPDTTMPEKNAAAAMPGLEARVLVCGSRDFADRGLLDAKLDEVRERLGDIPMRVISGAARGADRMAAEWAASNDVPCDEYAAEWDRYGKSAGYRRNERMLNEGRPHLVVGFPQGESRGTRMMMDIAARARVAVEEVDPVSRTTLTDTGELYDLQRMARRWITPGKPAGPVQAPGVGAVAKLPNNDPRTHGEARIVIGGVNAGAEQHLVHAKLDELLSRAHPAALRIAVEMQPGREGLSTVAASWARRRGVHCDQYRTDDPAQAKLTRQRMLGEQKPHAVVTFPRGDDSARWLAVAAFKARIPVEFVDKAGNNHTVTGTLTDLQKARQGRERIEPNPAWVVPVERRTATETNKRLGQRAADAPWAKPGHEPAKPPPTLNLRDRNVWIAVQKGEAVRIDRKTDWGNPFPLGDSNDPVERREVLERYRSYLADAIDSGKVDVDRLARLDGRKLACHCAPAACHGDVLSQAASWAAGIERDKSRTQQQAQEQRQAREQAQTHRRDADTAIDTNVFDPGDDDFDEMPAEDQRAAAERPPLDQPHLQHPDDLAADRLETYRDKLAEAGANEKQLEAIDADVAALRASAQHARTEKRNDPDTPMPADMRQTLDEHNRTVERSYHAPTPAVPPPPANEPTREVRVMVTGSREQNNPDVIYAKLDEIRQRIDGAPMRVVTGESRGAQKLARQWAHAADVPCDVHRADWDGAKAQYEADGARARNHDAERAAIDKRYPPGADGTGTEERQQALAELDTAVEWHERGLKAYQRQAVQCRDEDMLNNGKPHTVVHFETDTDRNSGTATMAHDHGIPCEHVDQNGMDLTSESERADLRAIGRRPSPKLPETPPKAPTPAVDSLQRNEQRSADHTHEKPAR